VFRNDVAWAAGLFRRSASVAEMAGSVWGSWRDSGHRSSCAVPAQKGGARSKNIRSV